MRRNGRGFPLFHDDVARAVDGGFFLGGDRLAGDVESECDVRKKRAFELSGLLGRRLDVALRREPRERLVFGLLEITHHVETLMVLGHEKRGIRGLVFGDRPGRRLGGLRNVGR